ncbi:TRAP transporter, DctM subunit [Streptomyces sp. WMMB 714]|jgi:tripartite ATP-independent transporter DctM subunit|uniref:TRAP transporter large permease n=1 Tax=Streptomyces sp. WMMB 714 TaxID=1286822 RepID=UPI0008237E97|nr:TRAP transporter large permease [Streptomyces sp. WMMB 714]SCK08476.1 TRAP transporter, DctM subunit [Streptomyces sp. WMMB 714]
MMSDAGIAILAVVLLLFLIALRTPIFVALAVSGIAGLIGLQGLQGVELVPLSLVAQLQNYALVAAPLYILLGEVLAVSGLGRDLFAAAHRWFNRIPGGLGASAIGSSTVFGAMSGVSISSVAVIGRMAVPEMLSRGYRPAFASGTVTASGALAMLIPPSLMFILYSSVTGVSIAELFAGGLVPGLLLAAAMILYVVLRAKSAPANAPVVQEAFTWGERLKALGKISPALLLILLVLGSIYTGFATPTEAAAVGALAAFGVTGGIYRKLGWKNLRLIFVSTATVTASVLAIVGAAFVFTQMLVAARIPDAVTGFVVGLDISPYLVIAAIMVVLVLLGCLVDAASLLLVVTPILVPAIEELGFDPLWFGVLLVINLEMAVITPPVGLNLYTMKSVVPELDLADIFRGILPYLVIEAGMLALVTAVPEIATWLPGLIL